MVEFISENPMFCINVVSGSLIFYCFWRVGYSYGKMSGLDLGFSIGYKDGYRDGKYEKLRESLESEEE